MSTWTRWVAIGVVALACGGGDGDPTAGGTSARCPTGEIADGDSCSREDIRCPVGSDDCLLLFEVCRCRSSGRFECSPVDFGEGCAGLDGAFCREEGTASCSIPPPGGVRTCVNGRWEFFAGCPDECPGDVVADDAEPCTLEPSAVCRYDDGQCSCVNGRFRCCEMAPCS